MAEPTASELLALVNAVLVVRLTGFGVESGTVAGVQLSGTKTADLLQMRTVFRQEVAAGNRSLIKYADMSRTVGEP